MEKFKITKQTKRSVARQVKNELLEQLNCNAKSIYFGEFGIMYDCKNEEFYCVGTAKIEDEEEKGNCFYKTIRFDFDENLSKVTLSEIENKIFTSR